MATTSSAPRVTILPPVLGPSHIVFDEKPATTDNSLWACHCGSPCYDGPLCWACSSEDDVEVAEDLYLQDPKIGRRVA